MGAEGVSTGDNGHDREGRGSNHGHDHAPQTTNALDDEVLAALSDPVSIGSPSFVPVPCASVNDGRSMPASESAACSSKR